MLSQAKILLKEGLDFLNNCLFLSASVATFPFSLVDVVSDVLTNVSVKENAKDVGLEIPSINTASHFICNSPDGSVKLSSLFLSYYQPYGSLLFCFN